MKKHRRSSDGGGGVALGLIITPMLDMSFQILAFFIMTYNPSALEGHINGKLVPPSEPLISSKNKVEVKDNLLSDSDPDLEDTLQVVANAVKKGEKERDRLDGEPAAIYIKKKEDTDMTLVTDTDVPLDRSLEILKNKLKAAIAGGGAKGSIRLDCGADMKHRYVMQLYDICKGAGYQNVSFVAPKIIRKKD